MQRSVAVRLHCGAWMRGAPALSVASLATEWCGLARASMANASAVLTQEMAHALGRHSGQACTPQPCCVRYGELCRGSSSCLAARKDIMDDTMVLLEDLLKLSQVKLPHMYSVARVQWDGLVLLVEGDVQIVSPKRKSTLFCTMACSMEAKLTSRSGTSSALVNSMTAPPAATIIALPLPLGKMAGTPSKWRS
eukprot:6197774-Pleurochrysis_carterae.AAC.4